MCGYWFPFRATLKLTTFFTLRGGNPRSIQQLTKSSLFSHLTGNWPNTYNIVYIYIYMCVCVCVCVFIQTQWRVIYIYMTNWRKNKMERNLRKKRIFIRSWMKNSREMCYRPLRMWHIHTHTHTHIYIYIYIYIYIEHTDIFSLHFFC